MVSSNVVLAWGWVMLMRSENALGSGVEWVLDCLSDVFTTGEFRSVVGMRGGGVPAGLRRAEDEGWVGNVRPGRWVKTNPGFGSVRFVNRLAVVRAIYGDRPHRLSFRTPIIGLPVKAEDVIFVSTPFPVRNRNLTDKFAVREFYEREDSLYVDAEHVEGGTWRSTEPRALLECAMFPHRVYEPLLVMVYGMELLCRPEDLVGVADRLGWAVALQRLQSMALQFRSHFEYETLGVDLDPGFCEMLPARPKRWTHLTGSTLASMGHRVVFADETNRVWWRDTPDMLVTEFL